MQINQIAVTDRNYLGQLQSSRGRHQNSHAVDLLLLTMNTTE